MPTIAVVGEVVADAVLPPDGIVNGAAHLTVHPGGGPANTAVALSRLGSTARFAGRLSDRVGRKRLLYVSFGLGTVGMAIVAIAPILPVAYLGVVLFGLASGTFLAVDWALMTEIIPRASSGRYMGISNVATASASIFALALGGTLMDAVDRSVGSGLGPRAAYGLAVAFFIVGGLLLRPVDERHRPGPLGAR